MGKTAIVLPRLAPNVPGFFFGYSLWAGVSCAHYFVCGAIAHWMGRPFNLPHWLDGINRFFRYGLSGFVDLLVLALWWVILALVAAARSPCRRFS